MAVGDQDGRGVPMAPAVFAGSLNELLDFPLGKVLARPTAIGACIPGAVFSSVSRNVGLKLLRFNVHLGQKPSGGRAQGNVRFTPQADMCMRQRGRKTADVLTLPVERAVFVELAATGHFVPTDAALLASLAQGTVMARKAARDPANSAVWERAVRVQGMLSTKLRLTPQARCDPKTIGRKPPRDYPAPWE